MKTRKITAIAVTVIMAFGLSACSGSGNEYASVYLSKITELNSAGTADGFALLDVNGDSVPELIAASSEGSYNEDGNTFLFTVNDGQVVELMRAVEGLDGDHMYLSEGKNTILRTGGMMGSEFYTLYSFKGGQVEKTKELHVLCNVEDDTYEYFDGETSVTEDQYFEAFAASVSAADPYTAVDHDGLSEVNITIKDGVSDYETVSTQKYLSFDEMKARLEGM